MCTPATPRARSRRRRSRPTVLQHDRGAHARARRRARSRRAAQRAVRGEGRQGLRDRGEPAREPHGAVREQGDRRAARQGRGARDGRRDASPSCAPKVCCARPAEGGHVVGEGSGAAVQPLPRRRHDARARDALDRRGHGHRPHVRHGVRARARPGAGNTLPHQGTVFLSLADRDKDDGPRRGPPLRRARLLDRGDRRHRRHARSERVSRSTRSSPRSASRSASTRSISSRRARSTSSSTRPAAAARAPTACTSGGPRSRTASPASRRSRPRSRPRPASPRSRAASPRCGRCRSTTATASCGSRCEPSVDADAAPAPRPRSTSPSISGRCTLPNPVVAASGTFGHGAEVAALCDPRGLGAVTAKSVAAFAWSGNPPLRVTEAPGGGMLNSVGLPGPGVDAWIAHDLPALEALGARVIASIWGRTRRRVRGGRARR